MDKEISYKMSLLLDGELTSQETVALWKSIEQDTELADQWQRYNQVRSVINSLPSISARPDLVSSVHQALQSEPAILAPNRLSNAKHSSQRNQRHTVAMRRSGMVAASAVLALMVYGGYQQQMQQAIPIDNQPSTADIMTDHVVADTAPIEILSDNLSDNDNNVVAGTAPVEILAEPIDASASQVDYSSQIPSEKVFNEYLVNHGEYAYSVSPQPLMSGARIISQNAEE
ncbi:MAG: RseA family anti-sigma factor [Methylococcales bacterium]